MSAFRLLELDQRRHQPDILPIYTLGYCSHAVNQAPTSCSETSVISAPSSILPHVRYCPVQRLAQSPTSTTVLKIEKQKQVSGVSDVTSEFALKSAISMPSDMDYGDTALNRQLQEATLEHARMMADVERRIVGVNKLSAIVDVPTRTIVARPTALGRRGNRVLIRNAIQRMHYLFFGH